ncbi:hypothetical protein FRX31_034185 [Thalictrum thalictroides]|uniref:Uncharacterized protein n=1 Tax=Thalictrum thalictroides TaxID=46969 RepID=A0A7J6UUS9_THATH|nr:hypothetical protein FRX31_034185 [Thalictrum thalictroides]
MCFSRSPLGEQFPLIYNVSNAKNEVVSNVGIKVGETILWELQLRRRLKLDDVSYGEDRDACQLRPEVSEIVWGKFSGRMDEGVRPRGKICI